MDTQQIESFAEPNEAYVYVLIRTDISPAQQAVQVAHAAWHAGTLFGNKEEIPNVVMLSVRSRTELEAAALRLQCHGVEHYMFFEPDFGMGHSGLATRPVRRKKERHLLRKYPLYGTSANGVSQVVG